LLTVDPGNDSGTVTAMGPDGRARVIARLPVGPNPIVPIPRPGGGGGSGSVAPGLYVTDDITSHVLFLPAAELAPYAGDGFVGGAGKGMFWTPRADGDRVDVIPLRDNLNNGKFSLEAAIFIE